MFFSWLPAEYQIYWEFFALEIYSPSKLVWKFQKQKHEVSSTQEINFEIVTCTIWWKSNRNPFKTNPLSSKNGNSNIWNMSDKLHKNNRVTYWKPNYPVWNTAGGNKNCPQGNIQLLGCFWLDPHKQARGKKTEAVKHCIAFIVFFAP